MGVILMALAVLFGNKGCVHERVHGEKGAGSLNILGNWGRRRTGAVLNLGSNRENRKPKIRTKKTRV